MGEKDIRDKAIFCVLLYSWCRLSALIKLTVAHFTRIMNDLALWLDNRAEQTRPSRFTAER
jgi:hypothetical protein